MKKNVFVFLILCSFLVGCSSYSSDPFAYKTGFKGLISEQSNNHKEMYEGDVANINFMLDNAGAYDINNGIMKISVEDNYIIVNGDSKKYFELKGGSQGFPEGESMTASFSIKAKNLDENSIERDTDFHITSCYDYGTDLSVDVCIDSDVYDNNQNKLCIPSKKSINSGQGAPVAVNNVESRMVYDELSQKIVPSFTITIKNMGSGTVIKKSKVDEICSSEGVENEDFNIIQMKVEMLESGRMVALECSQDPVKLRENEKQIICSYPSGFGLDVGTYYTPLHINLEYGYMNVDTGSIKIKSINA